MLWRVEDRPDPASLPVVVFGDEGGIGLVARELPELWRQVASGQELVVDDYSAGFYHRDEAAESRASHEEFVVWLADRYRLSPAEDPDVLRHAAVAEYGEPFARWMGRFVDDEDFVEEFLMEIRAKA